MYNNKRSKDLLKKRLERKVKKIFFFTLIPLTIIVILMIFLFNYEKFQIKEIDLKFKENKSLFLDKNKILKEVNNILNERYLSMLNKKNYLFFPKDEIEDKLKNKFPSLEEIEISRVKIFRKIEIIVKEEKLSFVYCSNDLDNKKCFAVNNYGKIFYKYNLSNDVDEKNKEKLILKSDLKLKTGDNFFNKDSEREEFLKLIKFLEKNKKIKTKFFVKKNKYFYVLIFSNNTKILLNSEFQADNVLKKLDRIFKENDFKKDGKLNLDNIDYINLILKNKIPYCLKGQECQGNY